MTATIQDMILPRSIVHLLSASDSFTRLENDNYSLALSRQFISDWMTVILI